MVIFVMDSLSFLVVALLSGAIAGTILGLVNLALVEPYLDKAIGIEVQNAISTGEEVDQWNISIIDSGKKAEK